MVIDHQLEFPPNQSNPLQITTTRSMQLGATRAMQHNSRNKHTISNNQLKFLENVTIYPSHGYRLPSCSNTTVCAAQEQSTHITCGGYHRPKV